MRAFYALLIFIGMIFSAVYGLGDLFILVTGGIFILYGIINIIHYLKTGKVIKGLRSYEYLRGRKSALFMGGLVFALVVVFYLFFLIDYLL